MGSVEITRTTALYPSAVFVQWDIDTAESGTHYVDVYRSGSPTGPWEQLTAGLVNAYHYLDDRFNLPPPGNTEQGTSRHGLNFFSLSQNVYYRVVVTPPSGPANTFESVPKLLEPGLDRRTRLLKRKILRDEAIAFRKLNGIPLVVLKRRHWGTRCPLCWDPVTREATLEHCPQCFGTSFEGGYWAPVVVRGRRIPAPVQTQMTPHGDTDTNVTTFILLDYPRLEHKDVLVDLRRDDRYEVQIVGSTELRGVIVHQTVTASLLSRGAVEYKLHVEPDAVPSLY